MKKKAIYLVLIIVIIAGGIVVWLRYKQVQVIKQTQPGTLSDQTATSAQDNKASTTSANEPKIATSAKPSLISFPIDSALSRVTKKTFELYVTPKNSPESPERYTGYHTGVDFETFSGEENKDIAVSAICSGKIVVKKWASGYGGVLVEACKIENQDVTVIYGHLKLASINFKLNDKIKAGDMIGILGKGYSTETDGERKHLHLGIHKGTTVNIKGYVQNKSDLNGWVDALTLM
jgi:murein DD-endopeptidase MepM/ murein hydrolase activator NlpD